MKNSPQNKNTFTKVITYLDLTYLNNNANAEDIITLCKKAQTPYGHVAAVCIPPPFVSQAKKLLTNTAIKVATVANFPSGDEEFLEVFHHIKQAINDGADEIDVVMPYKKYLSAAKLEAIAFIKECRLLCQPPVILKVILETGALAHAEIIRQASVEIIETNIDFIKTSTGKINAGVNKETAEIILQAIKQYNPHVGFKASGGIKTIEQAHEYIQLAENILGQRWVTPQHFRIGSSSLLDDI